MSFSKAIAIMALGVVQAAAQTPTETETETPATLSDYPSLTVPPCWEFRNSLPITGAPAPPMDMSELGVSFALGSLYNTADPCKLPAITGSSAEEFSEWASEWASWQAQHISEFRVLWEKCSDEPFITDLVPVGPDACSTLKAKITGAWTTGDDDDELATKTVEIQPEKTEDGEPEDVQVSSASRAEGSLLAFLLAAYVFGVGA
ncbi:hypothetical protein FVEN_g1175 [Fusarium venenatum]|uniref:Infection structure specific protein n=1 Tax=Fusarium venenatum TaxID=56646 RepID=A0A2L2TZ06_9HYPO|nr:uncharacterized protein FVRRES_10383 [Fusarium venenatum]KAG8361393.1 hypothetical protein FVEN_g1175 [Fusarium venenatum]KAH6966993.1 hypothetical protein EDB82DRAFT_352691 [Fusarium venenatum]CEI70306.1 unnamed protein product [Fusarium venenatum]